MVLWFAVAALCAIALVALVRPLLRSAGTVSGGTAEDVFAAQLEELEADRARGAISEADAKAARSEIARRLLRTQKGGAPLSSKSGRAIAVAVAIALFVPAFAVPLYVTLGAPGASDQPLAARVAPVPRERVERLVAEAEERLDASPQDGEGWAAIAPAYQRLGRFEDAADAFARANDILGETASRLTGQAQSLALANEGVVTATAKSLFERALSLEPDAVDPAIFLAIAARQSGDFLEAGERWRQLLEESEGDEPWLRLAAAEFQRMAGPGEGGVRPGGESAAPTLPGPTLPGPTLSGPTLPEPALAGPRLPGPTREAVDAAAALPAGDRNAMIEQMVSRLDERLRTEGGSPQEWGRLISSYRVLGRDEDAAAATAAARAALDAEAFATIEVGEARP